MKTYEPRRNNECPNGIHAAYDPAKDPTQNECTCPWLIIASSTPVQHLTSWSRRELENVIGETDRGYFDPPGTPLRKNSMFLSPNLQRLVDMAEKEPVAAALTLLAGAAAHGDSGLPPFDAIAWDAEDACLSLRTTPPTEHHENATWRRLHLGHANVDAVTDEGYEPGGANPVLLWAEHPDTAEETGLPEALVATPHEPAQDYFAEDITGTALPVFDETSAAVEALPRRVPQVPSAIAEAAAHMTVTDMPLGAADATAPCICDIRGSAPDTYRCPEHPADNV